MSLCRPLRAARSLGARRSVKPWLSIYWPDEDASLGICGVLLWMLPVPAGDWPQWRGPGSQGISAETGLPTSWSSTKNLAWKASLAGTGASSPIVSGGLVIVTSQIGSYSTASGSDPKAGARRQYVGRARECDWPFR